MATPTIQKQVLKRTESENVPAFRPDAFFSEAQILRLQKLMQRVQTAQVPPEDILTAEEYEELQELIKAELRAAAQRAATLAGQVAA